MDSTRPTRTWSRSRSIAWNPRAGLPPACSPSPEDNFLRSGPVPDGQADTAIDDGRRMYPPEEFLGTERFRLEEKLGIGGMGTVWRAYDRQRGKFVALKAAHYRSVREVARLKHEFRCLASLSHPGIITPHELHQWGAICFFTMDLIGGLDWLQYVRHGSPAALEADVPFDASSSGPHRPDRALRSPEQFDRLRQTLVELADALEYLHERGYVHGDVKPSNVLVAQDGRLALIDFGLVFGIGDRELLGKPDPCLAGTTAYMAPELDDRVEPTSAVDWYAAGVMLFEAITGRLPFQGNFLEAMAAKRSQEPPPIPDRIDAPRDLAELCRGLLERDPRRRAASRTVHETLQPAAPAGPLRIPVPGRNEPAVSDADLRPLEKALQRAIAGKTTFVVVTGTSDAARSRILETFRHRIAAGNLGLTFAGRCREAESLPCKTFDEVVDQIVGHLGRLSRPFLGRLFRSDRDLDELACLFPAFGGLATRPCVSLPATAAPDCQFRAFATFIELIRRWSELVPIVLTLDDLEWDDAASASLAAGLVRQRDLRLLLVLGCRRRRRTKSHILDLLCSNYCPESFAPLLHEIITTPGCKTRQSMDNRPTEF